MALAVSLRGDYWQRAEIVQLVEAGLDRAVHGVVRWRRIDLQRVILERFGVAYHERTVGKLENGSGQTASSTIPRRSQSAGDISDGVARSNTADRSDDAGRPRFANPPARFRLSTGCATCAGVGSQARHRTRHGLARAIDRSIIAAYLGGAH